MHRHLRLPHTLDGLRHTNVIRLELVETDSGGESECTQKPVQERTELGDTTLGEVVNDGGPVEYEYLIQEQRTALTEDVLETDVGVNNQERAENGIHDRVQGAGSERSDSKGDQTNRDESRCVS
jgi:hypothetical protein